MKKEKKIIVGSDLKKEKFFKVFFFDVVYYKNLEEKRKKKIFQVNATNYQRAHTRVERFFNKNKVFKKFKVVSINNIEKRDINDRKVKEINPEKVRKVRRERLNLKRLQRVDHKEFGEVFIADPTLLVTRNIVGSNVLFWVPSDKNRMELKTIVFDPKYFKLDLELRAKILRGSSVARRNEIEAIIEKLKILERYSERAMKLDLEGVDKELEDAISSSKKQYTAAVKENGIIIADKILKLRRREVETSTGATKLKYTMHQCIRKAWRSKSDEYTLDDLQLALQILKRKGHKVPKLQLAM